MGTGNLHFPRDIVTESIFSTVIEFSKANPNTSLKDVRFILYDKDLPTVEVRRFTFFLSLGLIYSFVFFRFGLCILLN